MTRHRILLRCNLLRKRWKDPYLSMPLLSPTSKAHSTLTNRNNSITLWTHTSSLPTCNTSKFRDGHSLQPTCGCRTPFLQGSILYLSQRRQCSDMSSDRKSDVDKGSSALYVRRGDTSNVAVVDIDLDLKSRLANVSDIRDNIRRRGLEKSIDIDELVSKFNRFSALEEEQENLEEERESIAGKMKVLVKGSKKGPDFDEQKRTLISRGKDVRDKLKLIQSDLWELEADVTVTGLGLPTQLLTSTPDQDEVLEQRGDIQEVVDGTTHKEIGERLGLLTFSSLSPGAYYLHGRLAKLELELVEVVSTRLRRAGLQQFSCPDMTKSLVMEGCGEDFPDPEEVLTLQMKAADIEAHAARGGDISQVDKWDLLLNLCGGTSLPAIASFLCKMNIARSSLPLQWFSVGRFYKPAKGVSVESSGLLAATQATQASVFAVGESHHEAEGLYERYISVLWNLYGDCGLPVKLVKVGAHGLLRAEGAATRIEAWLPSANKYIKVAGVGMYNDFVSRRLMIKHSEDVNDIYARNYAHMVYGTALDVPRLLAAILENNSSGRDMTFNLGKSATRQTL